MIDQIAIACTGAAAVWCSQDSRASVRRWACILGTIGQPFWFYAAYTAEQWGILATCFLYSYGWARGVWTYWVRRGV